MKKILIALLFSIGLSAQTFDFSCATTSINGVEIRIQGDGNYNIETLSSSPMIYRITPVYDENNVKFYGWEFNHEDCLTENVGAGGLQSIDSTEDELIVLNGDTDRIITLVFGRNPLANEGRISIVRQGPFTGERYIYSQLILDAIPSEISRPGSYKIIKFKGEYATLRNSGGYWVNFDLTGGYGCAFVNKWKVGESHEYELLDTFSLQSGYLRESNIVDNTLTYVNDFGLEDGDELIWFSSLSSNQYYEINATVEVVGNIAIIHITRPGGAGTTYLLTEVHIKNR